MSFSARLFTKAQEKLKLDLDYFVKGNFWLLVARIIAIGSGMVLTILFANLLSPETFGFYKYIISLAGILGAFSLTGIGTALVNSIARGDAGTLRSTMRESILWGLLGSLLALSMAGYYLYHGNIQLTTALVMVAIAIPLGGSFGNYRHIYAGRADFKAAAIVGSIRAVIPVICIAVTLTVSQNPLVILASYFVSGTLVSVVLYFYTIWQYRVPKTAESTKSTLRFARYTSVLGFFTQLSSQADQFLVWHFVGPAGVAFYALATSPVEQLQSFSGSIFSLVAPKLAKKTEGELRTSLPFRMKQMAFGLAPIVLIYIFTAPFLFNFLFPKYMSIVWLSQLYAITLLLQPLGFVDAALIALEDTGKRSLLVAGGQAIKLFFLVVGIATHGIAGGIIALIAAELFNSLLSIVLFIRLKGKTNKPLY